MNLSVILYLLAVICFTLAAIGVAIGRVNLIALGLVFFVLVFLIRAIT